MRQKKLGLSLRGGGFKGASHLGLLRALNEHEIEVHSIIGSSVGAVAGLCHITGKDTNDGLNYIKNFNYHHLWDFDALASGYIADHQKIIDYGLDFFGDIEFESLKTPFFVQTTSLDGFDSVVFHEGDLKKVMVSTLAWPVLIPPMEIDGKKYIDGDLTAGYGTQILKNAGADVVIGVSPGSLEDMEAGFTSEILTIYAAPKRQLLNMDQEKYPLDMLIERLGGDVPAMDREHCEKAYEYGYARALTLMPEIKKLIYRKSLWSLLPLTSYLNS